MKCPKCGYTSFDHHPTCKKCQASLESPRQALGLAAAVAAVAALEAEATGGAPQSPEPAAELAPTVPEPGPAVGEPTIELDLSALEAEPAAPEPAPSLAPEPLELTLAQPVPSLEAELAAKLAALPDGELTEATPATTLAAPPQASAEALPEAAPVALLTEELPEILTEESPREASAEELKALFEEKLQAGRRAAAAAPKPPSLELELPEDLAALLAAEPEETDEAAPETDEGRLDLSDSPAGDLGLDDELRKFLEQEGTSLEALAGQDELAPGELTEGELAPETGEPKGKKSAARRGAARDTAGKDKDDDKDGDGPAAPGGGGGGGLTADEAPAMVPPRRRGRRSSAAGAEAMKFEGMKFEGRAPLRAGFWLRALALGLDAGLLGVLACALVVSSLAAFVWAAHELGVSADPWRLLHLSLVMVPIAMPGAVLLLGLAYFTCFHGLSGSTPGKMLLGLEVRSTDGRPLGFGRAFLRCAGYLLSATPLALGFIWAGKRDRLAWHDLMAGSEVLRA